MKTFPSALVNCCLCMMYSKASITLFILPAPLSAADKAPQCGQSGRVQLGWHNGVFHPTSPLPGSVLSWTRCGGVCVCARVEWGRVNNCCDTLVHLDKDLFFYFLTVYTPQPVFTCEPKERHSALRCCNPQACFILFCLTRSYCFTKWHTLMQTGLHWIDWDVGFSFVLLCG